MDFEKIKQDFKWDPSHGDYSKNHVSYERNLEKKKNTRSVLLIIMYIVLLIIVIALVYLKFTSLK